MSEQIETPRTRRRAFSGDRSRQVAGAALKAAWWAGAAVALRAIAKPSGAPPVSPPSTPPPPAGFFRRAWVEAFEKDLADVAAGLYPPMADALADPVAALRGTVDLMNDAPKVEARRRRGGAADVRAEAPPGAAFPAYYQQNFHFQSGGWFTRDSAQRYESQVETLFAGAAGPMRRRALSLLARQWRGRDHRGLRILDLACGSGAFLENLSRAFPRARLMGLDLSGAYLAETGRRFPEAMLVQANAERLPFPDASLDAVTCVYLFHELPPRVRIDVAAEIARVLKPGGALALADSIQPVDEPRLGRLLEVFPAYFHEPFYPSYSETDLDALFAAPGLVGVSRDRAFLTKAVLFEKPR